VRQITLPGSEKSTIAQLVGVIGVSSHRIVPMSELLASWNAA
jgi:hypothetical protein